VLRAEVLYLKNAVRFLAELFDDRDEPDAIIYDPVHLAAAIVISIFGLGVLFWTLQDAGGFRLPRVPVRAGRLRRLDREPGRPRCLAGDPRRALAGFRIGEGAKESVPALIQFHRFKKFLPFALGLSKSYS
jgi:hypothetical protein